MERRKPLFEHAHHANGEGCDTLMDKMSKREGTMVSDGEISYLTSLIEDGQKSKDLKPDDNTSRSWLMDVLQCVSMIPQNEFSLQDIYAFESDLQNKYQNNHHIKAKMRQQLQILRDKGLITFLGNGEYRKEF